MLHAFAVLSSPHFRSNTFAKKKVGSKEENKRLWEVDSKNSFKNAKITIIL